MKKWLSFVLGVLLVGFCTTAGAVALDFSGNIVNFNDVAQRTFSLLTDQTNVQFYTDSFQSGTNFDPILALWTSGGNLIAQNDDNPNIHPSTQTWFDSGLTFSSLTAGDYIFTVTPFDNFSNGTSLSDGFQNSGETPVPLSQYEIGGYYHVAFNGTDAGGGPAPVPEPGTLVLFAAGLVVLGLWRRRSAT